MYTDDASEYANNVKIVGQRVSEWVGLAAAGIPLSASLRRKAPRLQVLCACSGVGLNCNVNRHRHDSVVFPVSWTIERR